VNVLLVIAHPEPASFNGSMARIAIAALTAQGNHVQVSDLYEMGFDPVAGPDDFTGPREDPDRFRLDREQTHAHEAGTTAPDIAAEQAKVAWADLVMFQYPMWWFMPPAILKGWFGRVFTRGFALPAGSQVRHRPDARQDRDGQRHHGHVI
jgi:NAD(P)H dehydrogenase (quinone)